ncbi:Nuclear receptor 2C2-associated protein [Leucoagaricus sp. SymC.cos]|nr:Nuclear receptor 2C2-associated protein [Leucoagaricus sp. SymC.cos]
MPSDLVSLINNSTVVKVSSTLDRSVGKKNLTDGNIESCWTSQQGLPQSIQLHFAGLVVPRRVSLVFQGGFAGTRCSVQVLTSVEPTKKWRTYARIYPEDVNRRQTFGLQPVDCDIDLSGGVQAIKFLFEESSDFFGRITVYDIGLEGLEKTCIGANSKVDD